MGLLRPSPSLWCGEEAPEPALTPALRKCPPQRPPHLGAACVRPASPSLGTLLGTWVLATVLSWASGAGRGETGFPLDTAEACTFAGSVHSSQEPPESPGLACPRAQFAPWPGILFRQDQCPREGKTHPRRADLRTGSTGSAAHQAGVRALDCRRSCQARWSRQLGGHCVVVQASGWTWGLGHPQDMESEV